MSPADFDCRTCDHRDTPRCYETCEEYKKLQEENAAKRAYLLDAGNRAFEYEKSHTDLARRKKGRHGK